MKPNRGQINVFLEKIKNGELNALIEQFKMQVPQVFDTIEYLMNNNQIVKEIGGHARDFVENLLEILEGISQVRPNQFVKHYRNALKNGNGEHINYLVYGTLALGKLPESDEQMTALKEAMELGDKYVKRFSLEAAGKLKNQKTIEILTLGLTERSPELKLEAINGLSRKENAKEAIPQLERLLKSKNESLAVSASNLIEKIK